ncbi:MAG: hypothetical protein B7Z15_03960 [Rhizobiales bacterium 32-66-8]|nr:MAG: hypothetical protein B7Z15_03960 [Rhizobiales bacterium 32-66-8]
MSFQQPADTARRRVLLDCSATPLHLSPTGIPRVLRQYLVHAPVAARSLGIDLVPVEIAAPGKFRRFREANEPALRAARRPLTVGGIALKILLQVLRYLGPVLRQTLLLVGALLPLRVVTKTTARWARSVDKFIPKLRRRFPSLTAPEEPVPVLPGDILLVPGCWYNVDISDYAAARAQGVEIVFLLHDIMPVTLPLIHEYPWRFQFKKKLERALEIVDHYYCISWQTFNDLKQVAAQRGRAVTGAVAYNGFDPELATRAPAALAASDSALLAQRPWLMVGTVEPKKGHADAIAALESLWAQGYARPLVIIGGEGWHTDEILEPIRTSPWLGTRLFWLQGADDSTLAAFYQGAQGLIGASIAEGFGLPLLEAAACGTPVICRDLPVFREILGARGTYFSNRTELADAISALEAPDAWAAARAGMSGFAWRNWQQSITAVLADVIRPQRSVDCVIEAPDPERSVQAPATGMGGERVQREHV